MNFKLFKYPSQNKTINIGDYVQSLAAKQFLPKVDGLLNRDELNNYSGKDCKVIFNGWFTHRPQNWPPSLMIEPLFISFHLNATVKDQFLTSEVKKYLKKYAPIGCRDHYTAKILNENGIEAYYTGCLTLTLGQTYIRANKSDEILFVDALFDTVSVSSVFESLSCFIKKGIIKGDIFKIFQQKKLLKSVFSPELLEKAISIKHIVKDSLSEEERFEMADKLLDRYSKAKLVVTSRIHCALPCIAMGTPVIFLHGGFKHEMDSSRFDGIIDFFNTIYLGEEITTENFTFNESIGLDSDIQNPSMPTEIINELRKKALLFVQEK